MRWAQPRFSLRALLLAAPLIGVAVSWLHLPTWQAQRFVAAINGRDFVLAEQYCRDAEDAFPGTWRQHAYFEPRARLQPRTWSELARGQRQIVIGVHYGDGNGIAGATVECQATRRGIAVGMALP